MNLRPYQDIRPRLGANVYIDPAALVIGDVGIGDDASLWPGVVVRGEGIYAAPGPEMIFGATMEAGLADAAVDEAVARPLVEAGLKLFPGLSGAAANASAGVRVATPDGLPMAGRSTEGVMLAVGARRNGWLLAPLVAEVVAACVTGGDPGPFAVRLDPARFGGAR